MRTTFGTRQDRTSVSEPEGLGGNCRNHCGDEYDGGCWPMPNGIDAEQAHSDEAANEATAGHDDSGSDLAMRFQRRGVDGSEYHEEDRTGD